MSEEIVNDGEQAAEQPEDERDQTIRYWAEIVQQAMQHGLVIIEAYTCTKCNHRQFSCHLNAEILPCMNCGNRIPSVVPQRPADGEITTQHYHLAVNSLYSMSMQRQKTLPPLNQSELLAASGETCDLMARSAEEARIDTLRNVVSVVKKLADLE